MTFPSLSELLDSLAGVSPWAIGIGLAFTLAAFAARARAWQNVLRDDFPEASVSYRGILGAYAAGVGVNAVLPARLGDLLRLFVAKREVAGATYPALVSSILVIALVDSTLSIGFVSWAIAAGTLPGFGVLLDKPGPALGWVAVRPELAAAAAVVVAGGLATAAWFARGAVEPVKRGLLRGLAVLRDWPFFLGRVVTWIGLAWVLQLCALWWFLRAFGLEATLPHAATVQAVQSVAVAVPIAPNGAGPEQALLLMAFDGLDPGDLLAFAVGMRATVIAVSVVVGATAILLLLRTLRWRRLLHHEVELLENAGQSAVQRLARTMVGRSRPVPVRVTERVLDPPR